ncbi:MAG: D-sedoheptulose 7-phosphate isomerase [Prevotellaceae bacterium]|jgi:D-sedoheptulose 7-phosphate isomerase|nr:D-sedoheptulose 7-phosphate isomerase [Prevotellaceae bacterium]
MSGIGQVKQNLTEAAQVLNAFVGNDKNIAAIVTAAYLMSAALKEGHKIISCGNGGSMCDAMHFAEELTGRYRNDRRSLAAVAISDPSYITCTANDYGFDHVFSRYVDGFGQKGDVLLTISTSGNSANVLKAAETAMRKGMRVVALVGKTGGLLADLCDVNICVAHHGYADRVQEVHIKIIHTLIQLIEQRLNLERN